MVKLIAKTQALELKLKELGADVELLRGLNEDLDTLRSSRVLAFLLEDCDSEAFNIDANYISCTGKGPWDLDSMVETMRESEIEVYEAPHESIGNVVVGRRDWDEDLIARQIDIRGSRGLRIYSQEMWLAFLITGRDPFETNDPELLAEFGATHPALRSLMSDGMYWPELCEQQEPGEIIEDFDDSGVSESPLHYLGYKVGLTSKLTPGERREVLVICFEARNLTFSEDSSHEYQIAWGKARSAQRLYRMARHIKSLVEGRNGSDWRKTKARGDWIADYKWLKTNVVSKQKFEFVWPNL